MVGTLRRDVPVLEGRSEFTGELRTSNEISRVGCRSGIAPHHAARTAQRAIPTWFLAPMPLRSNRWKLARSIERHLSSNKPRRPVSYRVNDGVLR
jgi:hypothetical protein